MKTSDFLSALDILKQEYPNMNAPVVTLIATHSRDPFLVLISTILSLRTKDETTARASEKLFAAANTPKKMRELTIDEIEKLIYPVGFYRVKAAQIAEICVRLKECGDIVPSDLNALLAFNGVGRKTANLVLSLGFDMPAVCVDTHVHRISNRLGFLRTQTPLETEMAIMKKVARGRWSGINDLLVALGQTICKPISPICSKCPIDFLCEKKDVGKRR